MTPLFLSITCSPANSENSKLKELNELNEASRDIDDDLKNLFDNQNIVSEQGNSKR